jgi:Methyltransferase domain
VEPWRGGSFRARGIIFEKKSLLTMPFSIHSIYAQIFKIWRKKRSRLFIECIKPSAADILLDVGGYPGNWTSQPQLVKRIDTLNVHNVSWNAADFPRHRIKILVGDGCALALPGQSYDIGFSNSVIEHVGSWERQQQFAAEIRRVAKALWVQTPAHECPVEPHYLTPFIHYLPRSFQKKILRWFTVWGWIQRPTPAQINEMVETTRLLRKSEMIELFPDCEIITERLFGVLPKSYIAFRGKSF